MAIELVDVSVVEVETPEPEYSVEPRRESWIEDTRVANPMTRYPRYASRRSSWTPDWGKVGCVVKAADGTTGLGVTRVGPAAAPIIEYIGSRLEGENALATEKLYDMATRLCAPFTGRGVASYAISAIDLALWDLKGNYMGQPVYELAGGPARDEVTCYATGMDTSWHLELGFDATKLPCPYGPADGREGLRKNEELVADRREMVGNDVELMLDCWMAFDVEYAVRLADRLAEYDLKWLEEMLPPEELSAHERLRERLPRQTLATGEHWHALATFQEAAHEGYVDVLQPDIQWVGGMTAMKRIAAVADAADVSLIPHGGAFTPYGQHACYALPEIPWGEYFIGTPPGVPLEDDVTLPGMAVPEEGTLVPTSDPGFGIDVNAIELEPWDG